HVDLATDMKAWSEWEAVNDWLAAMDAPTCMSGWLRNHSALFHYQDTRRKLGYVTEIHPPREPGKGGRWAPDYWDDVSATAAEQAPRACRPRPAWPARRQSNGEIPCPTSPDRPAPSSTRRRRSRAARPSCGWLAPTSCSPTSRS